MVELRARHDYVLTKRIPIPQYTRGGIHLPTSAHELPQIAEVISIGWKNPEGIQPGNLVIVPKFGGLLYPLNDEDYYLYRTGELLAVIYD